VPVTRKIVLLLAVALLVPAAGCGLWPRHDDGPPPAIDLAPDFAALLGPADSDVFERLAGDVRPVSPETARLVGPTYGVAFDALATAATLDGPLFAELATGLAPDDIGWASRAERRAAAGRELVLAHVPSREHLPEPERGYGDLFTAWQIETADGVRPILRDNRADCICTGTIVVVSVPTGGVARLRATVDGETRAIDLRTGTTIRDTVTVQRVAGAPRPDDAAFANG
jgi:hypothetical protein